MIYVLYGNGDIKKAFYDLVGESKKLNDESDWMYDSECFNILDLDNCLVEDVIAEASYGDLFGNEKIVLVKNCTFLTGKSSLKDTSLNNYIENPNPNTMLILSVNSEKLDERKKIVQLLREKAEVIEVKPIDSKNINGYIKDFFNERNYKIDYNAINEIALRINDNTILIDTELEKLLLYKLEDKTITLDDIKKVIVQYDADDKIFKLVDATLKKDKALTFKLYKELIDAREEPTVIISLIASQLRLILQASILSKDGFNEKDIASKLKEHPYRVKLALESYRRTNKNELLNNLTELSDLDYKIKKGDIDKVRGLETFLLSI